MTLKERFGILVWIVFTALTLVIASIIGFRSASALTLHHPATVIVLTILFLPLLLLVTGESEVQREPTSKTRTLVFLLILVSGEIAIFNLYLPILGLPFSITAFLVWFILPLFVALAVFKMKLSTLGFTRLNINDVAGVLILTLAYGFLVFITIGLRELLFAVSFISHVYGSVTIANALQQAVIISVPILLLGAAIPEEFMWRVILQTEFTQYRGTTTGILISTLLFGLAHTPTNYLIYIWYYGDVVLSLSYAFLNSILFQTQVGLILAVAWQKSNNLLLPVSLHQVHNMVEMAPLFLLLTIA